MEDLFSYDFFAELESSEIQIHERPRPFDLSDIRGLSSNADKDLSLLYPTQLMSEDDISIYSNLLLSPFSTNEESSSFEKKTHRRNSSFCDIKEIEMLNRSRLSTKRKSLPAILTPFKQQKTTNVDKDTVRPLDIILDSKNCANNTSISMTRRYSVVSFAEDTFGLSEKTFTCSSCSVSFSRKHDLNRHMKIHSGDKPFCCPSCSRSFSRNDALSRHIRKRSCCKDDFNSTFTLLSGKQLSKEFDSSRLSLNNLDDEFTTPCDHF